MNFLFLEVLFHWFCFFFTSLHYVHILLCIIPHINNNYFIVLFCTSVKWQHRNFYHFSSETPKLWRKYLHKSQGFQVKDYRNQVRYRITKWHIEEGRKKIHNTPSSPIHIWAAQHGERHLPCGRGRVKWAPDVTMDVRGCLFQHQVDSHSSKWLPAGSNKHRPSPPQSLDAPVTSGNKQGLRQLPVQGSLENQALSHPGTCWLQRP